MNQESSNRYKALLNYLANGCWKEADEETYEVMCQVIGKKGWNWEVEDIQNIPCEDLRILDQLWVQFSGGRFGFSVQRDIYVDVGGKLDGEYYGDAFEKFSDRVKWRVGGNNLEYDQLTFDLMGALGHLPRWFLWDVFWEWLGWGGAWFSSLAQRTASCNI